jgi:hypothetical protein
MPLPPPFRPSIIEDGNAAVKSRRDILAGMAVALLEESPLSRVLSEIHLDIPAFWKKVEERLSR